MTDTLNLNEAAELLHVHPITLIRWVSAGTIRAGRMGRAYLFIKSDLLDDIRGTYTNAGTTKNTEVHECLSSEKIVRIGMLNSQSVEKQYTNLLERQTKQKLKK